MIKKKGMKNATVSTRAGGENLKMVHLFKQNLPYNKEYSSYYTQIKLSNEN